MPKRQTDYCVASATNIVDLRTEVMSMMEKGFICQGGIDYVTMYLENHSQWQDEYHQAMVKEKEVEHP